MSVQRNISTAKTLGLWLFILFGLIAGLFFSKDDISRPVCYSIAAVSALGLAVYMAAMWKQSRLGANIPVEVCSICGARLTVFNQEVGFGFCRKCTKSVAAGKGLAHVKRFEGLAVPVTRSTFRVHIRNQPFSGQENLLRSITFESAAFLRKASLDVSDLSLVLYSNQPVGSISRHKICRIRLKKRAVSPWIQMIRPSGIGAGFGFGFAAVLSFKAKHEISATRYLAVFAGSMMFFAGLVILANIRQIAWFYPATVVIDSSDGQTLNFVIDNKMADELIALLSNSKVPIEPL